MKKDVQEVKHGHWVDEGIFADGHLHHAYRCSICKEKIIADTVITDAYCRFCGAKMEVGKWAKQL